MLLLLFATLQYSVELPVLAIKDITKPGTVSPTLLVVAKATCLTSKLVPCKQRTCIGNRVASTAWAPLLMLEVAHHTHDTAKAAWHKTAGPGHAPEAAPATHRAARLLLIVGRRVVEHLPMLHQAQLNGHLITTANGIASNITIQHKLAYCQNDPSAWV